MNFESSVAFPLEFELKEWLTTTKLKEWLTTTTTSHLCRRKHNDTKKQKTGYSGYATYKINKNGICFKIINYTGSNVRKQLKTRMSNLIFILGQIVNLVIVGGRQKDLYFNPDSDFSIFVPKPL